MWRKAKIEDEGSQEEDVFDEKVGRQESERKSFRISIP
jgi:hypothetical protein